MERGAPGGRGPGTAARKAGGRPWSAGTSRNWRGSSATPRRGDSSCTSAASAGLRWAREAGGRVMPRRGGPPAPGFGVELPEGLPGAGRAFPLAAPACGRFGLCPERMVGKAGLFPLAGGGGLDCPGWGPFQGRRGRGQQPAVEEHRLTGGGTVASSPFALRAAGGRFTGKPGAAGPRGIAVSPRATDNYRRGTRGIGQRASERRGQGASVEFAAFETNLDSGGRTC